MAKTNIQRNAEYYARLIKESKDSPLSGKYNKVCEALEQLVQVTDQLKGAKHKMSTQEYTTLVQRYDQVKNACREYLAGNEFSTFEEKRKSIITDISSVVDKDLSVLMKCDPMEPGTLSAVMEKSRTHKVILNKDHLRVVGAAQSSRFPIQTKNGKKGFFTPTTTLDMDEEWKKSLKSYEARFGSVTEECKKRLELLKTDEDFQINICYKIPLSIIRRNERYAASTKKAMAYLAYELGMVEDGPQAAKLFTENDAIYNALIDFSNSVQSLVNKQGILHVTGIKKGANLSSRNCAMTDMAKMLGCSNVLANSVPMKIEVNGQEIDGVFMESAEGTDINRLKATDPLLEANPGSFENPKALQQVIDLQALDFICGNTDRHMGNMVYQFKKTFFGGVKFTGIKGIDNDCAFGIPDVRSKQNLLHLVRPNNMKYVTTDFYQRMLLINKPMLKVKLAHHHLSDAEIDAAWDRIGMVRQAVKDGLVSVIDKDHWKLHSLLDHKVKGNYISKMRTMQLACAPKENEYRDDLAAQMQQGVSQVRYAQETVTAAEIMAQNENAIRTLRDKMEEVKSKVFDSSEYKLMKTRFEKIEKLTEQIKGYENPRKVPEPITDALRQAYIELADKTERYIALKKIVPATEKGEKRLDFAKELKEFASSTLEKLDISLDKETEKETEELEKEENVPEM